jgi:starch-binding outer membrane protein, SusD/RagB family
MKKYIIALLVASASLLSGCQDFLKEAPVDRFVGDNFYQSAADAEAGVYGVYQQLYSIYRRNILLLNDLPADDHKNGLGMPNQFLVDLEFLRYTAENTFVRDNWRQHYSGIQRANTVIANISRMNINEATRKRLIAEASFLRALYYFNLVRFHGDVPLILTLESIQDARIPRTPKAEVYAQIISDLKVAETDLPKTVDAANQGRATAGAAKILLGKVYLTQKAFQAAADKLAEVVKNEGQFGYGLHPAFADNWREATENGKESVFSIELMEAPGTANTQMALEGPKYSVPGGAVPGYVGCNEADIPTMDLYNSFEAGDSRKATSFKTDFLSPKTGQIVVSSIPMFAKYWQEGLVITNNCSINMHILRYADALLMYAEALNEVGSPAEAAAVLNRVRERAFGNKTHNITNLGKDALREKIYLERRLELSNEGQRWFDLVRTDRFVPVMKSHGEKEAKLAETNKTTITANVKDYQVLFPIPQVELDINPLLTQNPGY